MPDLTPAARKNLARGATTGAGTSRCSKCGNPKEEARLNSGRCKSCDGRDPVINPVAAPRDATDAALAWIVKNRLVLPEGVKTTRHSVLAWARAEGFNG